jgi:FKBP-type peptidyl-prolyl cis-trans isomerase FkpA
MKTFSKTVITLLLCMVAVMATNAQHIPEEVRIGQYIKKHHAGAEPQMNGLYLIKQTEGKGPLAKIGKNVTVHYEGKLLNNNIFDSSIQRGKPFTFKLGEGIVIAGWEQGISQMREGDKAVLIIPSYLGYGDRTLSKIPANSPLVFTIELLKADQ